MNYSCEQAHREGEEQGILPRGPQTFFWKRGPMRLFILTFLGCIFTLFLFLSLSIALSGLSEWTLGVCKHVEPTPLINWPCLLWNFACESFSPGPLCSLSGPAHEALKQKGDTTLNVILFLSWMWLDTSILLTGCQWTLNHWSTTTVDAATVVTACHPAHNQWYNVNFSTAGKRSMFVAFMKLELIMQKETLTVNHCLD